MSEINEIAEKIRNNDIDLQTIGNAELSYEIFDNVHLEGANLEGANLEGCEFYDAHLEGANLNGARLEGAKLYRTHLEGATLIGTNMIDTFLSDSFLNNTNLTKIMLTGSDLTNSDLTGSDLTDADLIDTDLNSTIFIGANLSGSNLTKAALFKTNFTNANLTSVNLFKTYLFETDFTNADLTDANLTDVNLTDTILTDTILTNTILTGTILEKPTNISRQVSQNMSNQHDLDTCWAHSAARVMLKAIKKVDPVSYASLNPDKTPCDEFYDTIHYNSLSTILTTCVVGNEFNSIIIYIYFYKLLTHKFGCDAFLVRRGLSYLCEIINNKTIISQENIDIFNIDTIPDADQITCNTAIIHLFTRILDDNIIIDQFTTRCEDDTDNTEDICKQLIIELIDDGYYIIITGPLRRDMGHAMTIVGYKIYSKKFTVIIKDSLGYRSKPRNYNFMESGFSNYSITPEGFIEINIVALLEKSWVNFIYVRIIDDLLSTDPSTFKSGGKYKSKGKSKKSNSKKSRNRNSRKNNSKKNRKR
jgi:uncharacterized protein YjbI with pentapeptide repeats